MAPGLVVAQDSLSAQAQLAGWPVHDMNFAALL